MPVSFVEDDWIRDQALREPRWVAHLDDGSVVYDDTGRPGEADSAWVRLSTHLAATGRRISRLLIQNRSNVQEPVPAGAPGYFFRSALVGEFGGVNQRFFLVGHLDANGRVRVQRWAVPELRYIDTEFRDPSDDELVGPSLILF